MPTIHDRVYLGRFNLSQVTNLRSHHRDAALLCAKMSRAVYAIKEEQDPQGVKWIPSASLREVFKEHGPASAIGPTDTSALSMFTSPPEGTPSAEPADGDMRAFVATSPGGIALGIAGGDTIIVAFRGTQGNADWGINLFGLNLTGPQVVDYGPDSTTRAHLHAGFRGIAFNLAQAIAIPLQQLAEQKLRDRILFCGHSLGGALALIAGQPDLADDYPHWSIYPQAIYSFAAPMVGDRNAARLLSNVHFRHVLKGDKVPSLHLGDFTHAIPPALTDPYSIFKSPGIAGRLREGWRTASEDAKGVVGQSAAAAAELVIAEHDIDLYIDVMAALRDGHPRGTTKLNRPY